MNKDLQALENWVKVAKKDSEDVVIGGQVITVRPFGMGQLAKVFSIVGEELNGLSFSSEFDVISKILQSLDKINKLLELATGKPLEWVEALPADEGMKLIEVVYRINKDFFTRTLMPMLEKLFPQLTMMFKVEKEIIQESQQPLENGLAQ